MRPLKPHKVKIPIIIGIDTEDNQKGSPNNFICMAAYCANIKKAKFFTDRQSAREFLLKKRRHKTIFWAHNLQYELSNLDFPEGSIQILTSPNGIIGGKYGKSVFMDTARFFQTSLKKLGEIFNVKKHEFNTSLLSGKTWSTLEPELQEKVKKYCIRDAKITAIAGYSIAEHLAKKGISLKCYTAASMALRVFRAEALKTSIKPRNISINDIERLAYYGGRTEVFDYRKHEQVFYDDINSSYPYSMTQPLPHPAHFERVREKYEDVKDYFGITLAKIYAPEDMHIPILPCKAGTKLIFPTGKWVGAYTHAELNYAEQMGYKIEAIESIIYPKKFTALAEFIKKYYEMKKSCTNETEKAFYKLIMNSLYGKFAEKRIEKIISRIELLTPEMLKKYEGKISESAGWVTIRGERLPDTDHTFPILSAYITAYSRIKLYEDRLQHSDKILYCDTDSAISEEPIDINIGDGLGQWKRNTYSSFQAIAPKFYFIENKKKIKGVPTHAKEIDALHYIYFKPLKLAEALRRKLPPNQWIEIEKILRPQYDKRIKNPDGTTKPLKVCFDAPAHRFEEFVQKV